MRFFNTLTESERRTVRMVWRWKASGMDSTLEPSVQIDKLDGIIHKLWKVYGKYKLAVANVEEIIDDIETLEDKQSLEETEEEKEILDASVETLREIIEVCEYLRHNKE